MNRIDGVPTEFEWKIFLGSTKVGILSCQCLTTLYGENKETQKSVFRILLQLRSTFADSLAVISLSWGLDQKKSGTEPLLTNQMDHGIEWQKKPWKPAAPKHLEQVEISTVLSKAEDSTSGETYDKNTSKKSSNCRKTRSYPNFVLMRV